MVTDAAINPVESSDSATDLVEHLLAVARDRLGMEMAWVSSFRDGMQILDHINCEPGTFDVEAGISSPLADSYCQRVVDGRLPNIIPDTAVDPITAALSVTEQLSLGSYIGFPLLGEATEPIGMLCCVRQGPATHLGDNDLHTLEIIAELVMEILTKDNPKLRHERMVEARIKRTIADRNFSVVYQPIVDVATGEVVGVEALSRFVESPARPSVWFAEAQSVGLGVELEIAAIELAIEGFDQLGAGQFMTLNASTETIRQSEFLNIVKQLEPSRVVVGITDTGDITLDQPLEDALRELRDLGVQIGVDHVGASFASGFDGAESGPTILSLDRSITDNIHVDPGQRALAEEVIELAKAMDARIVATGIETQLELDALMALGVDQAQGFLLAHPQRLPAPSSIPLTLGQANEFSTAGRAPTDIDQAVRQFELAMLHSPVGMALIGLELNFIHVNPAFASLLGRTESDFSELVYDEITHPDERELTAQMSAECLRGDRSEYRTECRYGRPDGSFFWCDLSVVLVRDETGQALYWIAQIQETTERHMREQSLTLQATTDHLTTLSNRAAARANLELLVESATPFGLLYCDLRNFKRINDTYGHQGGDHVLVVVAQRLKNITRGSDHVSRWGGDEFVVVVPRVTPEALLWFSRQVAEAIAVPVNLSLGADTAIPELTIGTAIFDPNKPSSIDEVLHLADSHMYRQRKNQLQS